jgi:hypothetical protein
MHCPVLLVRFATLNSIAHSALAKQLRFFERVYTSGSITKRALHDQVHQVPCFSP